MQIRVATETDRQRWDEYVLAHRTSTPFHLTGWSRAAARAFGHEELHLLAEANGELCGVLPLVHLSSVLTGSRLLSTPFAGHGGPLADGQEIAGALIRHAEDLTDSLGVGHLELHFRSDTEIPESVRDHPGTDSHLAFRRQLPADEDELLASIHRDNRRLARRAAKAGLVSRAVSAAPEHWGGDGLDRAWLHKAHALIAGTMHQLGSPSYPISYLRELLQHDPHRWFAWCTYDGDTPVSVTWVAGHGDCVYPQVAGTDAAYRRLGVNDLHYQSLMIFSTRRGVLGFDFGRSKVGSGSVMFKRHFGFEGVPASYRFYLSGARSVPNNSPSNGRYAMAINLWRRLPLPVTKTLGPALLGHFA